MRSSSATRRDSERATRSVQRRQPGRQNNPYSRARQQKAEGSEPKLMSSYPEVQPLLIETDADVLREFRQSPRRHAIVSIYGEDLDERMLEERKIA